MKKKLTPAGQSYTVVNNVCYLALSEGKRNKGLFTKFDLADLPLLGTTRWCFAWTSKYKGYVCASRPLGNGKYEMAYLHRELFGNIPGSLVPDHINKDTLDNTRSNLRLLSTSDNSSVKSAPRKKSVYRGVYPRKKSTFLVRVRVNNKYYHKLVKKTEKDAAMTYDRMLIKATRGHCVQDRLNFPTNYSMYVNELAA